ncbi:hypothetical protein F7646_12505, partial [Tenacibaculum finnmarkense genomovar finnmarkense]
ITFKPDAGFTSDPTPVTYNVEDNDGNVSNDATITLNFTPQAPAAVDDTVASLPTNTDAVVNPLIANGGLADSDPDGSLDATTVSLVGACDSGSTDANGDCLQITVPGQGVWTVDPVSGAITFKPDAGFTSDPTPVTYNVEDNDGNVSNDATITLNFSPQAPVAVDDTVGSLPTNTDAVVNPLIANGGLADSDPDGSLDATTVSLVGTCDSGSTDANGDCLQITEPGQGVWTVDPVTGAITFNPDAGFTSDPTPVTYNVEDNDGNVSNDATITLNFTPQAPVATDDTSTGNTPGDDATIDVLDNDKLSDGSPITDPETQVTIDLDPTTPGVQNTLDVPNQGTWTVDPATGILTFNPIDGFTQTPTDVVYTLTEISTGLSDTATVKAGYTEVDPIATDDTSTGNTPGDDATIDVLDNDKLSDGSSITDPATQVTIDLDPTTVGVQNTLVVPNEGTWTVDPVTGILTFNPDAGFTQTPTDVVYTLTEISTGLSDTAMVKVEYTEVDTAATEIDTPVVVDIFENDSDIPTSGTISTTTPTNGTVEVTDPNNTPNDPSDDVVTYVPDTDFSGTDTFEYTVCDNASTPNCQTATVTIKIGDIIKDDPAATEIDTPVVVDIFENDSDIPTSGTISTTTPTNGTVEITDPNNTPNDPSDDVVTYVPDTDFSGTDTFEYTVCDNASTPNCQTATVTIVVVPEANPCGTPYNIMTPDNDGENDSFFISCIDKPEYANNTVEIFNRWGNTVYKASGYNNESVSFKGISNGRTTLVVDEKLPAGTYYYVIDLGDGSKAKAGWLYINR